MLSIEKCCMSSPKAKCQIRPPRIIAAPNEHGPYHRSDEPEYYKTDLQSGKMTRLKLGTQFWPEDAAALW